MHPFSYSAEEGEVARTCPGAQVTQRPGDCVPQSLLSTAGELAFHEQAIKAIDGCEGCEGCDIGRGAGLQTVGDHLDTMRAVCLFAI